MALKFQGGGQRPIRSTKFRVEVGSAMKQAAQCMRAIETVKAEANAAKTTALNEDNTGASNHLRLAMPHLEAATAAMAKALNEISIAQGE